MQPDDLIKIARELILSVDYSILSTISEDGSPDARLMQHFPPEEDLTLWYGTSPVSRKAGQLRADNRVALTFQHGSHWAYVTLYGTMAFVTDMDKRRKYFFGDWHQVFPEGPESENFVLLKFTPKRIEMIHLEEEVAPLPYGLTHANLIRKGSRWFIENKEAFPEAE